MDLIKIEAFRCDYQYVKLYPVSPVIVKDDMTIQEAFTMYEISPSAVCFLKTCLRIVAANTFPGH